MLTDVGKMLVDICVQPVICEGTVNHNLQRHGHKFGLLLLPWIH